MKPIFFVTLITLAAVIAILAWYGLFTPVHMEPRSVDAMDILFRKHQGDYRKTGPIMDAVYTQLKEQGVVTTKGIGIFYDNPKEVQMESLRSLAGCVLPKGAQVMGAPQDGLFKASFPQTETLVFSFPYKGKLSVIIGLLKAHPKIDTWFESHPEMIGPVMEIYDVPNKEIFYIPTRAYGGDVVEELW